MFTFVTKIEEWYKKELAAGTVWANNAGGVGNAAFHGGWASLSAIISAYVLDSSKFNMTNGMKSEVELLVMTFLSNAAVAAYLYVKAHKAP